MSITDAAWFYSALAQSSAAIVGLIGALQISGVSGRRNSVLDARRGARTALQRAAGSYEGNRKLWAELRICWEGQLTANRRAKEEGLTARLVEGWKKWNGSARPPDQLNIEEHTRLVKADISRLAEIIHLYVPLTGQANSNRIEALITELTGNDETAPPELAEILRKDISLLEKAARLVGSLWALAEVLPTFILYMVLGVFSISGVLIPLGKLIVDRGGAAAVDQSSLLIVFAVALLGLLAYLIVQWVRILKLARLTWPVAS